MLTTFLSTLEQMSRILLLLVIGFSLNKFHILPKETEGIVSKLVTMLFLPCLMLYTNMTECQISAFASYSVLVLVGAGLCVGSMLLSYPLSRLLGGKTHSCEVSTAMPFPFPIPAQSPHLWSWPFSARQVCSGLISSGLPA